MAGRGLVVVGASAGGVEAVREVLGALPADLPAAIAVVLHVPGGHAHALSRVFGRVSALPVADAVDGERVEPGRVVVAPAGHHLLIVGDRWRLSRGPRENGHRPAVDALFRTAARSAGPRTVAVVLSGMLDDGAAGMAMVAACGGLGIAQDPEDALFGGMPTAAIAADRPRVVPLADVAAAISEAVAEEVEDMEPREHTDEGQGAAAGEFAAMAASAAEIGEAASPTPLSCPDCAGVLHEIPVPGASPHYRCVVGHAWSPEALYAEQRDEVERALWVAVRALEERASLSRRMRDSAEARGHELSAATLAESAEEHHEQASLLRRLLERGDLTVGNMEPLR